LQHNIKKVFCPANTFHVDPFKANRMTSLPAGLIESFAAIEPSLHQKIAQAIPQDSSNSSYPAYFSEFVRAHLKRASGKALVLPANTEINGDLSLDENADWNSSQDITAIVVEGDLTIHGDLLNTNLNDGSMLFVAGTLKARNVVKGGASLLVLGDLQASGLVIGEYNDGVIRVGGQIAAQATLSLDHDIYARKDIKGDYHSFEETIWEEVLVSDVLEDDMPTGALILDQLRKGRSIFVK
jgi:hypothetical protein